MLKAIIQTDSHKYSQNDVFKEDLIFEETLFIKINFQISLFIHQMLKTLFTFIILQDNGAIMYSQIACFNKL